MEHERHAGLHPVGSAAFFEAIVNTTVSPFVVIDRDLILRFVSESATALLGWKPDEWVGRSIAGLLTEDSLEVAAAGLGDLNELPDDSEWVGAPVRVYVKRSDGTTIPIDAAARAEERTGIEGIVVQLHRAGGSQAMSDAVDAILDGNDLDRALTLLTSLIEHEISDTSAVLANEWDGRRFAQASGANTLMKLDWPLPADRAAIEYALDSGTRSATSSSVSTRPPRLPPTTRTCTAAGACRSPQSTPTSPPRPCSCGTPSPVRRARSTAPTSPDP